MNSRLHLSILAGALAVCAFGQDFRATISGVITDPQKAVVPGATVEVRNLATNVVQTVQTNESGVYVVPFLNPGVYSISATAAGFKKAVRDRVEVRVGDKIQADLTLEVGAAAETVTVTAAADMLETASASKGQVLDQVKVRDLPLLGRNPFMLAATATGVFSGLYTGKVATFGRPYDGAAAQMQMNGVAGRYEILLDGVANAPTERGDAIYAGFIPSPEAVQEFNVQTNIYDAQYGRTSGAVVNLAIKGGTNSLHGSIFHYFRHDKLTANLFESNWAGRSRATYRWNQPGVEFDGPVWIPRVYDGRNRTFFMFSFEAIRNSNPSPFVGTMPTELQRQGDFSRTLQANGQPITIYDPLTTRQSGATWIRDPFPSNRVPSNRFDPVAMKLVPFWPMPNQPGNIAGQDNFLDTPNAQKDAYNQYVLRIDQQLTPANKLTGRWSKNVRTQTLGTHGYPRVASSGYTHWRNNHGGMLNWTSILRPTLVADVRYGYLRHPFGLKRYGDLYNLAELGFPSSLIAQLPRQTFPGVTVSDFSQLYSSESQFTNQDYHNLNATVTKVAGVHSLKTGFEFRALRANFQLPVSNFGTFGFNRGFTQRDPLRGDAASGNGFATFLLGFPASGSVAYNIASAYQMLYWAGFFQDDWRVNSRLTLNLGLRWDYEGPLSERYDRQNRGFDRTAKSPLQVPGLDLRGGLLFTDKDARLPFQRDLDNWQPRAGFALRVNPLTVLRGGIGLTYMPTFDPGGSLGFSTATGFVASTDGGLTPAGHLRDPYPSGILQPPGRRDGLLTLIGQSISYGYYGREIPKTWQFSLGIQRQLPWRTMVDVSYIGSRSGEMGTSKNINAISAEDLKRGNDLLTQVPNPLAGKLPGSAFNGATVPRQQLLRPYPHFNNITQTQYPVGHTAYNSLQIALEKRLSGGLHFRGSYTWSKNMTATGYLNDQDPIDSPVWSQAGAPNHVFTLSGGYALPFFAKAKGWRGQLGGWQTNFIFRAMTGNLVGAPSGAYSSGVNPKLARPTWDRWFSTCTLTTAGVRQNCASADEPVAWIQQPPFTLRTLGSNLPGIRTEVPPILDFSLFKDFPIREKVRAQVRAEAFNLGNTPMFGAPNTTLGSASFGRVTAVQANDPRIVQLALRILF